MSEMTPSGEGDGSSSTQEGLEPVAPAGSDHVAVPKWVLAAIGGLGIAAIFFALGWIAAPADSDSFQRDEIVRREFDGPRGLDPFGNRNNGGRNDDGGGGGQRGAPSAPLPAPNLNAAFLGVAAETSSDPAGARVTEVATDTPAEEGGLEVGDVITKVDDETVADADELATRVRSHESGDEVTITYTRNDATATARVRLTSRSSAFEAPEPRTDPAS